MTFIIGRGFAELQILKKMKIALPLELSFEIWLKLKNSKLSSQTSHPLRLALTRSPPILIFLDMNFSTTFYNNYTMISVVICFPTFAFYILFIYKIHFQHEYRFRIPGLPHYCMKQDHHMTKCSFRASITNVISCSHYNTV